MGVRDIIKETFEDNAELVDQRWIMAGSPEDMTKILYERLQSEIGVTQAKLQNDVKMARMELAATERREAALIEQVSTMQDRIKTKTEKDE